MDARKRVKSDEKKLNRFAFAVWRLAREDGGTSRRLTRQETFFGGKTRLDCLVDIPGDRLRRSGEGKGEFPNRIRFNARTLDETFLIRFRQSTNDSNAKVPSFGFVPCQKRRLAISRSHPIVETLSAFYMAISWQLATDFDCDCLRTSERERRTYCPFRTTLR